MRKVKRERQSGGGVPTKPMPEDHFDLAYHIQPKYWKGQFIPQIEWLDYHMASREKIENRESSSKD